MSMSCRVIMPEPPSSRSGIQSWPAFPEPWETLIAVIREFSHRRLLRHGGQAEDRRLGSILTPARILRGTPGRKRILRQFQVGQADAVEAIREGHIELRILGISRCAIFCGGKNYRRAIGITHSQWRQFSPRRLAHRQRRQVFQGFRRPSRPLLGGSPDFPATAKSRGSTAINPAISGVGLTASSW